MWMGAALSLVAGPFLLGTTPDAVAETIRRMDPASATDPTLRDAYPFALTFAGIFGLTIAAVWAWMAWKNRQGRAWARIVATIFLVLNAISAPGNVVAFGGGFGLASSYWVMSAVLGVAALVLIWRRPSSQYYDTVSRQRLG